MKVGTCCVRYADGLFSKVLSGNSKGRVQTNRRSTFAVAADPEPSLTPVQEPTLIKKQL